MIGGRRPVRVFWLVMVTLVGATGCGRPYMERGRPWLDQQPPEAGDGRPVIADLVVCDKAFVAVGSTRSPTGATHPAVWYAEPGGRWTSAPTRPVSAAGQGHQLTAVGCSGGRVAAIGMDPDGAADRQQVTVWRGAPRSGLTETPTAGSPFNGANAAHPGRIAGGHGFVVTGNRLGSSGPAGAGAWFSADGATFTPVDLASQPDREATTWAADAAAIVPFVAWSASSPPTTAAVPDPAAPVTPRWLIVGSTVRRTAAGTRSRAQAWSSTDGRQWTAEDVPAADAEDSFIERVVVLAGKRPLAVGRAGAGFAAWERDTTGAWRMAGRFGQVRGSGTPVVAALTTGDPPVQPATFVAAVCDGESCGLWSSSHGSSWRQKLMPTATAIAAGPRLRMFLAASVSRLMLCVEDGERFRTWQASRVCYTDELVC